MAILLIEILTIFDLIEDKIGVLFNWIVSLIFYFVNELENRLGYKTIILISYQERIYIKTIKEQEKLFPIG